MPINNQRINFINIVMKELNYLCDSLYEALADNNDEEVVTSIDKIEDLIKDIKLTFSDDI